MVYVTGDMHGDYSRFSDRAIRRLKKDDILIVCGDFGFLWDGSRRERRLLEKIGKKKYTVLFVDGIHENYTLLDEYPVSEAFGGRVQIISGKLMHLMRGERYTIDGETYFVMGGGEERIIDLRREPSAWSEREQPSEEELIRGLKTLEAAGWQADYVITHEPSARTGCFCGTGEEKLTGLGVYFNRMEENVTFTRWFFGSVHQDKAIPKRYRAVFRDVVPIGEGKR